MHGLPVVRPKRGDVDQSDKTGWETWRAVWERNDGAMKAKGQGVREAPPTVETDELGHTYRIGQVDGMESTSVALFRDGRSQVFVGKAQSFHGEREFVM